MQGMNLAYLPLPQSLLHKVDSTSTAEAPQQATPGTPPLHDEYTRTKAVTTSNGKKSFLVLVSYINYTNTTASFSFHHSEYHCVIQHHHC
jgi:hypothetical protein